MTHVVVVVVDFLVPDWIDDDTDRRINQVSFCEKAERELADVLAERQMAFYSDAGELKEAIKEVLAMDIRSVYQRKSVSSVQTTIDKSTREEEEEKEEEEEEEERTVTTYKLLFDSLEVEFCYPGQRVIEVSGIRFHNTNA